MIECSFICLCVAVMWCSMMIFYQNLCIYNIYNLTYRNEKWCAMSDILKQVLRGAITAISDRRGLTDKINLVPQYI